ncbi:MAG: beta-propeller domain-containing protein [Propionibacteriaceae bacterium]|jgi:uncharacterized secreted protein with C-terminal beta-propeller domain|nr:beta-propeller domain-containing protein [Propionibacteriaceae bacterium]
MTDQTNLPPDAPDAPGASNAPDPLAEVAAAMRRQMAPDPAVVADLYAKLDAEPAPPRDVPVRLVAAAPVAPPTAPAAKPAAAPRPASAGRSRRRFPALAGVGTAVLAVALAVVPLVQGRSEAGTTTAAGGGEAVGSVTAPPVADEPAGPATAPPTTSQTTPTEGDYGPVYDALQAAVANQAAYYYGGATTGVTAENAILDTAEVAKSSVDTGRGSAPAAYSETNVQVEGIDEADIVKTDGSTIFYGHGRTVTLLTADGAGTSVVSRIDVTQAPGWEGTPGGVADLMLAGTTLVVFAHDYSPDFDSPYLDWTYASTSVEYRATQTRVLLYDVTDPANPTFREALGQSGSYSTARLMDGVLYTVTTYSIDDPATADPDDPVTYVPLVTDVAAGPAADAGTPADTEPAADAPVAQASLLPATDIAVFPSLMTTTYAVATAIDVATGARLGEEAVLGGADTVYMSADNLYLGGFTWSADPPVPDATWAATGLADGVTLSSATTLARIALDGGALTAAATTMLPGAILNQFSLDEYDGYLRLALTISGWSDDVGWSQKASLLVLGLDLQPVGSIADLAVDEGIQSVRFSGSVVHIVTYRQTDPLFAIDLSDPTAPTVLGELKIPGFSTYLHPWGDGWLVGLGQNTTDEGVSDGLKLSLFNVADPVNIAETAKLVLPWYDVPALYDHRAVWADVDRGLVGFAATDWTTGSGQELYLVYRVGTTIEQAARLELAASTSYTSDSYSTRGVRVGESLYVVAPSQVTVYALDGFTPEAAVAL